VTHVRGTQGLIIEKYLNVGYALGEEGGVEGSNGGVEAADHGGVAPVEDLAADEDVLDFCLRVEGFDVRDHPLPRGVDVLQHRDVTVGGCHRHGDAGVREGLQDLRAHVVDLHAVDRRPRLQKVGHRGRRR